MTYTLCFHSQCSTLHWHFPKRKQNNVCVFFSEISNKKVFFLRKDNENSVQIREIRAPVLFFAQGKVWLGAGGIREMPPQHLRGHALSQDLMGGGPSRNRLVCVYFR